MGQLSKTERLAMIFERVRSAPASESAEEALSQLEDIINDVEDEFTEIPRNPPAWASDGRLYPPQADYARSVVDHPTVTRYRSIAHNTFIAANGAIEIRRLNNEMVLSKAGIDGRKVWT